MRLFIKHLATWLLTIYLVCAFVQWYVFVLHSMGEQNRVAYFGISLFLSVFTFFVHLAFEDEI